ncbi:MAG: nodulation protein NfeD [Chloroflexota bacterium]|nr:nodulation protein NfeD [Chloroflexota bacterium]MDE2685070.1 nodulation protein NfeD [Chloroflexota bacterium]
MRVRKPNLVILVLCSALVCLGLIGTFLGHRPAEADSSTVFRLRIEDTINPVKARVIARAVATATEAEAQLLVVELDTPGGLYGSTREIVETLLESDVPVAVFVSPRGAQAGSAGTFITAAGHVAAMAPGSNIGAATPVSGSGEDIGETLADKVTNDASALIRSIADERGRNADALEQTVRTATSYSASEAFEAGIIDLLADNLPDLLAQLDGQTVPTVSGERVLELTDYDLQPIEMQWRERFVDFIADPNIAFLLISLGSLGLVFELMTPGAIGPGIAGIICLGLGFLALGNLPFNWAGIAFIVLAVVLAVLEIFVSGFGALGIGAVVSLIIGGVLLFGSFGGGDVPVSFPDVSVSPWVLVGVGGFLALCAGYFAFEAVSSRVLGRRAAVAGSGADSDGRSSAGHLIGQTGRVTRALDPRGIVNLGDETWSAVSSDGLPIPEGRPIRVVGASGLLLTVESIGSTGAIEGQE